MLDFLKIFFYIFDVFYFIVIRLFLEGYHHFFVKIYIISAKNIYVFLKIFTKGKSRIFTRLSQVASTRHFDVPNWSFTDYF